MTTYQFYFQWYEQLCIDIIFVLVANKWLTEPDIKHIRSKSCLSIKNFCRRPEILLPFEVTLSLLTGDFWNIKARSVGLNFCLQCLTPSIGRRPKLCKEMKSWCWGMDTRKSWRDDMLSHYLNSSSQNTNKTFDYRTNYTHTHI